MFYRYYCCLLFFVVRSHSHVQLFASPCTAACQASLSFTISWSLLKLMSIESMMPSNHLILYCPLLLLPSIFPSIRVFSNESALCIRWPNYWNFSFSISPSNEYSRLISFRMDWFDLAVQGTLKSLLQYHTSKASIFQHSALFTVQLSHLLYMTTEKNHSSDYMDLCLRSYFLYLAPVHRPISSPPPPPTSSFFRTILMAFERVLVVYGF